MDGDVDSWSWRDGLWDRDFNGIRPNKTVRPKRTKRKKTWKLPPLLFFSTNGASKDGPWEEWKIRMAILRAARTFCCSGMTAGVPCLDVPFDALDGRSSELRRLSFCSMNHTNRRCATKKPVIHQGVCGGHKKHRGRWGRWISGRSMQYMLR
jgi:hypothetical protein